MPESEQALCPECGKRVGTGVPAGGDGSAEVYYRHLTPEGKPCPMGRSVVRRGD